MTIPFNNAEADFVRNSGTRLTELPSRRKFLPILSLSTRRGDFRLENDCGHLVQDPASGQMLCDSYEDPARPKACQSFEPGTYPCRELRYGAGIDSGTEFLMFLEVTSQSRSGPPTLIQPPAA